MRSSLDPPFDSKATGCVFFAEHHGEQAASQIKAFEDTWTWDRSAEWSYKTTVEAWTTPSRMRPRPPDLRRRTPSCLLAEPRRVLLFRELGEAEADVRFAA
jgi:hypothetical protein